MSNAKNNVFAEKKVIEKKDDVLFFGYCKPYRTKFYIRPKKTSRHFVIKKTFSNMPVSDPRTGYFAEILKRAISKHFGENNIVTVTVKSIDDTATVLLKKGVENTAFPVVVLKDIDKTLTPAARNTFIKPAPTLSKKVTKMVNIPEDMQRTVKIAHQMTLITEFMTEGIEKAKQSSFKDDADFLASLEGKTEDQLFEMYKELDAKLNEPIPA